MNTIARTREWISGIMGQLVALDSFLATAKESTEPSIVFFVISKHFATCREMVNQALIDACEGRDQIRK